ncbi:MAG TPA: hypothetical protein VHD90_21230 [Phototrophicaceae bacterium]|nr:hypothetical protein [Phototrophicaceae bacterium]
MVDRQKATLIAQRVFFWSLVALIALTLVLVWLPNAGDSLAVKITFAVAITVMLASLVPVFVLRASSEHEKSKRGLEGLDLYTVIDRLVADLDDDEAAYLQRRLNERDTKAKDELTVSLGDLLDQRAEARRPNDER